MSGFSFSVPHLQYYYEVWFTFDSYTCMHTGLYLSIVHASHAHTHTHPCTCTCTQVCTQILLCRTRTYITSPQHLVYLQVVYLVRTCTNAMECLVDNISTFRLSSQESATIFLHLAARTVSRDSFCFTVTSFGRPCLLA